MAARGTTTKTHLNRFGCTDTYSLTVSDTASTVTVDYSVKMPCAGTYAQGATDWEMKLQREVNGVWSTISGSFTGFVHQSSPSQRTFKGITPVNNSRMRVVMTCAPDGRASFNHYSNIWTP